MPATEVVVSPAAAGGDEQPPSPPPGPSGVSPSICDEPDEPVDPEVPDVPDDPEDPEDPEDPDVFPLPDDELLVEPEPGPPSEVPVPEMLPWLLHPSATAPTAAAVARRMAIAV
jgi:hypothetical protein